MDQSREELLDEFEKLEEILRSVLQLRLFFLQFSKLNKRIISLKHKEYKTFTRCGAFYEGVVGGIGCHSFGAMYA